MLFDRISVVVGGIGGVVGVAWCVAFVRVVGVVNDAGGARMCLAVVGCGHFEGWEGTFDCGGHLGWSPWVFVVRW